MSIRVANIRLELGEPEEIIPQKVAARLGLAPLAVEKWRILRKSLDARSHDDVHFVYAAAVDLAEEDARLIADDASPRPFRLMYPIASTGRSRARGRFANGR